MKLHQHCVVYVELIIAFFCFSQLNASDRILPKIMIDGLSFSMNYDPLEHYWVGNNYRPKLKPIDSASGDHKCSWELLDDILVLTDFQAISAATGKELGVEDLFSQKDFIAATWFTGSILIAEGEVGTGAFQTEKAVKMVMIEEGRVLSVIDQPGINFDVQGRVGISLQKNGDKMVIDAIASGSPADVLDCFSPGDTLLAIESMEWGRRNLDSINLEKAVAMIRGPHGSKVVLRIQRLDQTELEVSLLRGKKSGWRNAIESHQR